MRIIGLDPGLRHTGWGVVAIDGTRLRHIADGTIHAPPRGTLAQRLVALFDGLDEVMAQQRPDAAAVEETFLNKNPGSTLKLGAARGVVLLVPALRGIPVAEYSTNLVKKAVVGAGHADKHQIEVMVGMLLPGTRALADAADALAVAVCHAHHVQTSRVWERAEPLS
jgi:crossover junction endodeoxyribonuclease RuvC